MQGEAFSSLQLLHVGQNCVVLRASMASSDAGGTATEVALKACMARDRAARARFMQEVALQTMYSHSNIVRVLGTTQLPAGRVSQLVPAQRRPQHAAAGAWLAGSEPVLASVMELCSGGSLADAISQQRAARRQSGGPGAYTRADALQWLLGAAQALAHLHGCRPRLLHRDVKPENILLCPCGPDGRLEAKLADLGLTAVVDAAGSKLDLAGLAGAQRGAAAAPGAAHAASSRSNAGSNAGSRRASAYDAPPDERTYALTGRCGTLLYMAPEVLKQQPYNERADIFSLGLVAWELLTGCSLSAGLSHSVDSYLGRAFAMAHDGWRPDLPAGLPPRLADMVSECWHEAWQKRPSASELVCDLQLAQQAEGDDGEWLGAAAGVGGLHGGGDVPEGGPDARGGAAPPAGKPGRVFGHEMAWQPPGFAALAAIGSIFSQWTSTPGGSSSST